MSVRLGVTRRFGSDPDSWIRELRAAGYLAAVCPVGIDAPEDEIRAYERAARKADILISEVGAWSNPLSRDEKTRSEALEKCKKALDLADRIGANCCVNISGSRGERWDGHDPANLTPETFDLIVEAVRDIIDSVKPTRTYYTLEAMPWMYPTGPDDYLALLKAIDRDRFAVHLDPVNMIWSPERYYRNGALMGECFEKLGPYIRNCHAKDTRMHDTLTVHLQEALPGEGNLDYAAYLRCLDRLPQTVGLIIEHLQTDEEYDRAAAHIRGVASQVGVDV